MKKLLLVLAIGAFVACNESATEETPSTDSATNSTLDPNTTAPALPDTATVPMSDTSATKADSAASK